MPMKEIVNIGNAAPNPNLSPATKFGNLVFVAGQTGRHPVTGRSARMSVSRPATSSSASRRS